MFWLMFLILVLGVMLFGCVHWPVRFWQDDGNSWGAGRWLRWCWRGWMLGLLLWVGDGDGEVWDMRGAV